MLWKDIKVTVGDILSTVGTSVPWRDIMIDVKKSK